MLIDKVIHALSLAHCLPLPHHMEVVSIRIANRKHSEGIFGDAW